MNERLYSLESYESASPSLDDSMVFELEKSHFCMWQKVILKCNMQTRRIVIEGYDGQVGGGGVVSGSMEL